MATAMLIRGSQLGASIRTRNCDNPLEIPLAIHKSHTAAGPNFYLKRGHPAIQLMNQTPPSELANRGPVPLPPPFPPNYQETSRNQSAQSYNWITLGVRDPPFLFAFIRQLRAGFCIHTDECATVGALNDGASQVVTKGGPPSDQLTIVLMTQLRNEAITQFNNVEKAAVYMASLPSSLSPLPSLTCERLAFALMSFY